MELQRWNSGQGLGMSGFNSRSILQTGNQVEKLLKVSQDLINSSFLLQHLDSENIL